MPPFSRWKYKGNPEQSAGSIPLYYNLDEVYMFIIIYIYYIYIHMILYFFHYSWEEFWGCPLHPWPVRHNILPPFPKCPTWDALLALDPGPQQSKMLGVMLVKAANKSALLSRCSSNSYCELTMHSNFAVLPCLDPSIGSAKWRQARDTLESPTGAIPGGLSTACNDLIDSTLASPYWLNTYFVNT